MAAFALYYFFIGPLKPGAFTINPALLVFFPVLFVILLVLAVVPYARILGPLYSRHSTRFPLARKYVGVRLMMTCFLLFLIGFAALYGPSTVLPWVHTTLSLALAEFLFVFMWGGIVLGAVIAVVEVIVRRAIRR